MDLVQGPEEEKGGTQHQQEEKKEVTVNSQSLSKFVTFTHSIVSLALNIPSVLSRDDVTEIGITVTVTVSWRALDAPASPFDSKSRHCHCHRERVPEIRRHYARSSACSLGGFYL
jgi:hypothetical protein